MANGETLLCERPQRHVLVVRFNRPAASNALNTQMGRDIFQLFHELVLDPGETRCVVLTGVGEKVFCAGGDLKERNGMSDGDWRRQHAIFEQAFYALMDCPIPVIAAVNGAAYGGGCEFALACDFIYAARTARFALTETSLGLIPGGGGTQQLPRAVGARRARELIYTAAPFSADEALAWGMINRLFPPEDLFRETLATAERIARNAPVAVRQAKRAIYVGADHDLKTGLAVEIEAYNRTTSTADRLEGIAAFNEKRPPQFRGE
jgi:enoyl-CoA hydratase